MGAGVELGFWGRGILCDHIRLCEYGYGGQGGRKQVVKRENPLSGLQKTQDEFALHETAALQIKTSSAPQRLCGIPPTSVLFVITTRRNLA